MSDSLENHEYVSFLPTCQMAWATTFGSKVWINNTEFGKTGTLGKKGE